VVTPAAPDSRSAPAVQTLRPSPSPSRLKSGHGRSLSNPFPALFGGGRKGEKALQHGAAAKSIDAIGLVDVSSDDDDDDEDDNDGLGARAQAAGGSPLKKGRSGTVGDQGLAVTSRCMTCDSAIRRPKDSNAFRCTVCWSVNDLIPYEPTARRHPLQRHPSSATRPGPAPNCTRFPYSAFSAIPSL
jgi:E3 ubiquitin-protein ligase HECTD2